MINSGTEEPFNKHAWKYDCVVLFLWRMWMSEWTDNIPSGAACPNGQRLDWGAFLLAGDGSTEALKQDRWPPAPPLHCPGLCEGREQPAVYGNSRSRKDSICQHSCWACNSLYFKKKHFSILWNTRLVATIFGLIYTHWCCHMSGSLNYIDQILTKVQINK